MSASVLVANHNYARFLKAAIEGVLAQTYGDVELVVVDDGSTDGSRELLASYGDKLIAIEQPQRGQAAALNAAFAASSGEIVCLLDADDVFEPAKVERVVDTFERSPDTAMVTHQMRTIDADGRPSGSVWPRALGSGDLRSRAARAGGWYPRPVCSALSFRRGYLERLFPIPTEPRMGQSPTGPVELEVKADTYLAGPAAFVGPVRAVRAPLTLYRVHGANKSEAGRSEEERERIMNRRIAQYAMECESLRETLSENFGIEADLSVEDHFEYQLHQAATGSLSRPQLVARVLSNPGLPLRLRPREALRAALGRGWSRSL